MIMRLVPRAYRFRAVVEIADFVVPFLRKTAAYREQQIKNFHEPREIGLHLLLNALTKNGTTFDPPFVVDGYRHFENAAATSRGVLVTGHHAALTLFMIRLFHDNGLDPIVMTPDSQLRVAGTLVTARSIQPSARALLKVRTSFRNDELICAMPDRAEHDSPRTFEFATPAGRVIMTPALIELAARCGAATLFTEVRLVGRHLAVVIVAPSCDTSDAKAVVSEFVSFVRTRTGRSSPGADRIVSSSPGINSLSPSA